MNRSMKLLIQIFTLLFVSVIVSGCHNAVSLPDEKPEDILAEAYQATIEASSFSAITVSDVPPTNDH